MIGNLIAHRYKIQEKIGEGGMAVVYKATDILLNRPVAVKVLRSQYAADEEFVERFRREAQAAASLSHPNVVNIYDVGEEEEAYYIVMEFVQGKTLKDLIREKGCLAVETALSLSLQIAHALNHAHKHGIVHRDIKPHNILLTDDGRVKVTDFGIARAVSSSTLTQTGFVVGSVHYFSPEQAKGANISEQSDLYSLGVLMYELFTGRVPFTGESAIAVALKHVQDKPKPPRHIKRDLPPAVEQVILKAMAKDPKDRYSSAGEIITDLQRIAVRTHLDLSKASTDEPTQVLPNLDDTAIHEFQEEDVLQRKKERQEKKKRRRKRTYLLLFILAFLAGLGYAVSKLPEIIFPDEVSVPDVSGVTVREAESILREQGLRIAIDREIYHDEIKAGLIISQNPAPNRRVREGRTVEVVVSRGPELTRVPDVIGLTEREAELRLSQAGFKVGEISAAYDPASKAGIVLNQNPPNGVFLEKGLPVDLVINAEENEAPQFVMPNLRGEDLEEAKAQIRSLGLVLGNVWGEPSTVVPEWRVIDHNPPPGQEISPGQTVDFVFSEGSGTTDLPLGNQNPNGEANDNAQAGETSSPNAQGSQALVREADVQVTVPPGPDQEVIIVVVDADGARTVYRGVHPAETTFTRRVKGRGQNAKIQVYIGGNMVSEQPFPK